MNRITKDINTVRDVIEHNNRSIYDASIGNLKKLYGVYKKGQNKLEEFSSIKIHKNHNDIRLTHDYDNNGLGMYTLDNKINIIAERVNRNIDEFDSSPASVTIGDISYLKDILITLEYLFEKLRDIGISF